MKIIVLFSLVLLLVITQQKPNKLQTDGDVIILDNTNLQAAIYESQDPWLLDLYAPWCGHCMNMANDWKKLAQKLKGTVKVAKIDASKYSQFNQMFKLDGYPHIVFIPGGPKSKQVFYIHEGGRSAEAFQKWTFEKMNQHKKSTLHQLTDQQKWKQVCLGSGSDFCVLFFLPKVTDDSQNEQSDFYLKLIGQPLSFMWAEQGKHKELENQFSLGKQYPSVAIVNTNMNRFSVMPNSLTEDDFEDWLNNFFDIEFQQYEGGLVFGSSQDSAENGDKKKSNNQL